MKHFSTSNAFFKAIPTLGAALEMSVIQPVFILPYLGVQLRNQQHHMSDLTWQLQ